MSYIKSELLLLPSLVDCAPSLSSGTTQFILTELITLSFLTLPVLTLAIWIASYFLDFCPDWSTEQNLHRPVLAFFSSPWGVFVQTWLYWIYFHCYFSDSPLCFWMLLLPRSVLKSIGNLLDVLNQSQFMETSISPRFLSTFKQ